MIRAAIAATVIALTLSGCAQILDNAAAEYRPASQFPQTPDVKQAVVVCGHEVHRQYIGEEMAANSLGMLSFAVTAPSLYEREEAEKHECMRRHGWLYTPAS